MAWSQVQMRSEPVWASPSKLFTPGVTVIIVLIIIGYTILSYAGEFTISHLALHPHRLLRGAIWQILTFSLINSGCTLAFNGLVVLFLGSAIEREWRTRSFIMLWIVVSAVCAIMWTLISLLLRLELVGVGSTPCTYGIIGAFGLLFRRRRFWFFFWTIEAQHLALIFIGIGIVLGIAQPITWIWVAGAGVAYVYIKLRWRLLQQPSHASQPKRDSFVDID